MPSMLNHWLFASDLIAGLSAASSGAGDPFASAVVEHRDIVLAGAQGPDPFFYYGKAPLRSRPDQKEISAFGDYLHAVDPAKVFPLLASRAAEEGPGRRRVAFAYLFGLLSHYLLDRALHPYVFYQTGFDSEGALTGRFSVDHSRFETLLGAAYLRRRTLRAKETGTRPAVLPRYRETAPRKSMRVDGDKLGVAGDLWVAAFPDRVRPRTYPDAWTDMRSALAFLWDPFAAKRAVYAVLGASGTKSRALIPPRRPARSDPIDYLNDEAAAWLHPVTGEPSSATVDELVATASRDAEAGREILAAAMASAPAVADASARWPALLRGVNHDGFREGETMRTYRSVYVPKR